MAGLIKENSEEKKMKKQEEKTDGKEELKTEQDVKQREKEDKKKSKKFQKMKKKSKETEKVFKDMTIGEYKRRKLLIPVITTITIIVAIIFSTVFAFANFKKEKIISGVSISGVDVSGLSQEEAKAKISELYQEKKEKEIAIQYEDYETTLNPTLMEVNYDIEKAVEEAYLIGKEDNIFVSNYKILFTLIGKKNIDVKMTLNEDVAKQSIEDIGVNLPGTIIESSHAVEEDELIITKGKSGIVIDTQDLLNQVKDKLNDRNSKEDYIKIPVKQKDPFTIYPEVE